MGPAEGDGRTNRREQPARTSFWASISASSTSQGEEDKSGDLQKWSRMLHHGIRTFNEKHPDKFQRRICRGIPPQHRWVVWKAAVGLKERIKPGRYQELCAQKSDWEQLINVDAPRTFPEISEFAEDYRNSMRQILYAYSNLNTEVGYCQGMNFVVGLLLLVSCRKEEEVFWMFTCLMEERHLCGFYKDKFPMLHKYLNAMSQLMESAVPELDAHFSRENLMPTDYLQQWFLTLFINCLPLPTVLIIWDSLICNGFDVLLSTTVALLQAVKQILLTMPFEDIMHFFRVIKICQEDTDAVTIGQLLMNKGRSVELPLEIRCQLQESESSTAQDG